tara:strand:+ start:359 stop:775 length:417 start_codon:yes stop_codon:yes gene_type:complete
VKITIINGPNLNLIGKREVEIYGEIDFNDYLKFIGSKYKNFQIDYFQSNIEGEIINKIHESDCNFDAIIINAGGYSHYSVAILDALKSSKIRKIEVHITNIYSREEFRSKSILSSACDSIICGFGLKSYELAIKSLMI